MAGRMGHRARHRKRVIEAAGGRVAAVSTTGSGHLRFVVVLPDGNTRPLICASTSSDVRADRNVRAMVRRWCATAAANDGNAEGSYEFSAICQPVARMSPTARA